ncbi:MAG: UDP-glucose 4-epimerase GalE [Acidobacteria bacterium]|nr:UDP-glucose 4-epimerase GalE [Acidobacteriota bacterium]
MRVLVTGGAGYIGSIVNEELLKAAHQVVVYDSLVKGHAGAVPGEIPLIKADLNNRAVLIEALLQYGIEAVIHMAADSLVGESMADPGRYYHNNLVAGIALLESMRECGVNRIVFSSTAAVYGEPSKQPVDEDDPVCPLNPYGETKLAFERALHWYCAAYGLSYVSLRYFNAAGASERFGEWHQPETHLIPLVLQAALGMRPFLHVYGDDYPTRDGTCVRDYIHVTDLARAHVLSLAALTSRFTGRIFNLGCGGAGYTVREVIEMAEGITGKAIPVEFVSRRPGDPAVLVASSEKIRRELGWRPERQDLFKIIGSAWEWLQAHPEGYAA